MSPYFCTQCSRDHHLDSALFGPHKPYAQKAVSNAAAITVLIAVLIFGFMGGWLANEIVRAREHRKVAFNALPDYRQDAGLVAAWKRGEWL